MAITRNREVKYEDWIEFVEHITGKKILSWRRENQRLGMAVFFTDKTMTYIEEGGMIQIEGLVYEPIPKSICVSCGQDMHAGPIDWLGRCEHSLKHLWEKARKVYWHRYLQNKLPKRQILKDKL